MLEDMQSPLQQAARQVEAAVADQFSIHDRTLGIEGQPETIRLRGHLLAPSDQAYPKIAARLRKLDYTAELRHDPEPDLDVLLAMPGVQPQESGSRVWVSALLYGLTILSTLFVGVTYSDQVPPDASLTWILSHLWLGIPFSLSLMIILTGHELGHYVAGRYYKVPVSLPYFIPMPFMFLGTMGAFIVMKGRTINRRQMLTVGAAGPLVGFVLAVPILLLGLFLSTIKPITPPDAGMTSFWEGNSLLYLGLKFAVFGQVLPGSGAVTTASTALGEAWAALLGSFPIDRGFDVFISPVALAGWAGLLVTAFNLLPVGQLDGGHVLYSLIGQRAKVFTWPIIGILILMGFLLWPGWYLWAGLIFVFGQSHPDPLDDVTRLDAPRVLVALLTLLVFVLTFTPLPMRLITGAVPGEDLGQGLSCFALPGLLIGGAIWLARRSRARRAAHAPTNHG